MRPEEQFCGEALAAYLGGPTVASFLAVEKDPPDLILTFYGHLISVEVTQTADFTFEGDRATPNRRDQESYGIRLIKELNRSIGPTMPDAIGVMITLFLPVAKPGRFKASLRARVLGMLANPAIGVAVDEQLDGARVRMQIVARTTNPPIFGAVGNTNTSADIGANAVLSLQRAVEEKSKCCADVRRPIWLTILNVNPLADAETYALAAKRLVGLLHHFERIFIVERNRHVVEIHVPTRGWDGD